MPKWPPGKLIVWKGGLHKMYYPLNLLGITNHLLSSTAHGFRNQVNNIIAGCCRGVHRHSMLRLSTQGLMPMGAVVLVAAAQLHGVILASKV